jgi:hypothetical protein
VAGRDCDVYWFCDERLEKKATIEGVEVIDDDQQQEPYLQVEGIIPTNL